VNIDCFILQASFLHGRGEYERWTFLAAGVSAELIDRAFAQKVRILVAVNKS